MEIKTNNFNEIEYFSDLAKIRYAIANVEKEHHLVDEVVVDNRYGSVNPIYGRIMADGSIGLAFSAGYPEYIYTPYGEVKIDCAAHDSDNLDDKLNLLMAMKEKFGLVVVEPALSNKPGEIGTRYAITKLPWKANQNFPKKYTRTGRYYQTVHSQISIVRHVDQVQAEVNNIFLQAGQPEFVITAHQKKSKLNIATKQIDDLQI